MGELKSFSFSFFQKLQNLSEPIAIYSLGHFLHLSISGIELLLSTQQHLPQLLLPTALQIGDVLQQHLCILNLTLHVHFGTLKD